MVWMFILIYQVHFVLKSDSLLSSSQLGMVTWRAILLLFYFLPPSGTGGTVDISIWEAEDPVETFHKVSVFWIPFWIHPVYELQTHVIANCYEINSINLVLLDTHGILWCQNIKVPAKPEILHSYTTIDHYTTTEHGASFCCVVDWCYSPPGTRSHYTLMETNTHLT